MTPLDARWGYTTTPGFEGWEPERVASELHNLGYRWIEWTPDFCGIDGDTDRKVAGLVAASRDTGLQISQLMAMTDYVSGDDAQRRARIDATCRIIDAAAASGVGLVSVYAGPDSWDSSASKLFEDLGASEAWSRVFAALDIVVEQAEQRGIAVTFKPCVGTVAYDHYSSTPVLSRYRSRKGFSINYDPSHFALARNDVPWTIREFGTDIRHVQLKDVFGIPGTEGRHFNFPMIGDGIVDWRGFFTALADIAYAGPLIALFETFALYRGLLASDPIAAARATLGRLRLLQQRVADGWADS